MAKKKAATKSAAEKINEPEIQSPDNQGSKGGPGRKKYWCPKCKAYTSTKSDTGACKDCGTIKEDAPKNGSRKKADTAAAENKTAPDVSEIIDALTTLQDVDLDELKNQINALEVLGGTTEKAQIALDKWRARS